MQCQNIHVTFSNKRGIQPDLLHSSFKSNADPASVLLLASHFLTHTFFSLAISSPSASAICISSNLHTFFNYSSTRFPVNFTFDSFETTPRTLQLKQNL
jgi:hypothetical protein